MSTKRYVLELLEKKRGRSISGEVLAERLNLSRSAVWKAVKELEKDGYKIKAVTNKGYCLCDDNDILSVEGMLPFLSDKKTADRINIYASLESTNTTAKEMAVAGAEHGTILIADYLSRARGRYERNFFTLPGHGVYMSVILRPSRQQSYDTVPTLVTAYAAVSVCAAVEEVSGKMPQIKWVNDVFLEGKKICGILTEAVSDFESGGMQWIVVGIGVNFIEPADGFPENIRDIAGALFCRNSNEEKPMLTRNRLAAEIANRMLDFENKYERAPLLFEYKKRLMTIGKRVTVSGLSGGETFEANAIDIDEMGRLIVEKEGGEIMSLSSGEVSLGTAEK